MHVQSGGVWGGCNEAYLKFTAKWKHLLEGTMTDEEIEAAGYSANQFKNKWGETGQRGNMFKQAIMGEYFHIYRGLWRSHMCALDNQMQVLKCPETCSQDTPFEECQCTVPDYTSKKLDWMTIFPCILNSEDNRNYFKATMPPEMLEDITEMMVTASVLEGEMVHAASPSDILFWAIHPVIERLLQAKRLSTVNNIGGYEFYKWTPEESTQDNWLSWSFYNIAENTNKAHLKPYTCIGHAAQDQVLPDKLPLTDVLEKAADSSRDMRLTNWEFFEALDPNDPSKNDYVFDHFTWEHCEGKLDE
jgi:hypothetical protein